MSEDLGRALDDLRFAAQIIGDAQRTICCEPERVSAVQAAIDEAGLGGILTVIGSPACPEGKLLVIDDPALQASSNASLQRAMHHLKINGRP